MSTSCLQPSPFPRKNFHVRREKFPKSNYMYGSAVTVTQIANFSPDGPGLDGTLTMFVVAAATAQFQ